MPNCFSTDLILINMVSILADEAISALSCRLEEHRYVNTTFCSAVLEREKIYHTGLPLDPMGVTIPHIDPKHIGHMVVVIDVLQSPFKFGLMGGEG